MATLREVGGTVLAVGVGVALCGAGYLALTRYGVIPLTTTDMPPRSPDSELIAAATQTYADLQRTTAISNSLGVSLTNSALPSPTPNNAAARLNSHQMLTVTGTTVDGKLKWYAGDFNRNTSGEHISTDSLRAIVDTIPNDDARSFFAQDLVGGLEPNPQNGTILRENDRVSLNVPAGGFAYTSSGPLGIEVPGMPKINLKEGETEGVVNQVIVLGLVNATGDSKNMTVKLTNPFPGHIFVTQAQPSDAADRTSINDKVNKVWFAQQLAWGGVNPNCSTGCKTIKLHIIDPNTKRYSIYEIDPAKPNVWKELKASNGMGKTQYTAQNTSPLSEQIAAQRRQSKVAYNRASNQGYSSKGFRG